jgi:Na+/proline symporter
VDVTDGLALVVYLLPVGVVAYTMVGGLKATILTDWAHTFILLIVLIIFALTAYASHDVLGSPGAVYDLVVEAAARHPVAGNKNGSYLTMQSREGAIFFVINIVGELLPCSCPTWMIVRTGRCHLRSARCISCMPHPTSTSWIGMPCLTIVDEANKNVLGNFGTVMLDNGFKLSWPLVVLDITNIVEQTTTKVGGEKGRISITQFIVARYTRNKPPLLTYLHPSALSALQGCLLVADYFELAIAASPAHALPGYLLGGLCWFAIPWLTATTMGLTALAMENNPSFPTYPDRMADADVSAGLVLPYAAVALLGKGGAIGTLLIIFMAVTSATSSQLIAVSTICTYDLYRTYFNPTASGKRLIYMSHMVVVGYGIFIATFSVGLWYAGISMGYLYLMMGVIISAAVLPAALTLIWYVSGSAQTCHHTCVVYYVC